MPVRSRTSAQDRSAGALSVLAVALLAGCGSSVGPKGGMEDPSMDAGDDGASHLNSDSGGDVEAAVAAVDAGGAPDSGGLIQRDSGTTNDATITEAAGPPDTGGLDTSSTEAASEAAAPTNVVAVPLTGCIPSYMANVSIGTPAQSFALILDTGSTTLAVASSTCADCGVSPVYTPGTS